MGPLSDLRSGLKGENLSPCLAKWQGTGLGEGAPGKGFVTAVLLVVWTEATIQQCSLSGWGRHPTCAAESFLSSLQERGSWQRFGGECPAGDRPLVPQR